MSRRIVFAVAFTILLALQAGTARQAPVPPLDLFYGAAAHDAAISRPAMEQLAAAWRNEYTSMIVDMARLMRPAGRPGQGAEFDLGVLDTPDPESGAGGGAGDPGFGASVDRRVTPESVARRRLIDFLRRQTGKRFDQELNGWREWMWTLPYDPHPDYAQFKGAVYARVDPQMSRFFPPGVRSLIRLDEVDWGGVTVNGIPPLRNPKVVPASGAGYLRDSHIVFGVVVNGEARAYPRRILAWHELAQDRLGGVELTVVYCTLCGTVIPYDSVVGGRLRRFGTSGLLYRSNKLMFDEESRSLWSAIDGRPVIGNLVGAGLQLTSHPVVTTTWKEWKADHPGTTVLSLDTGFTRDYGEGAAYRDYFSTDALYFQVSHTDRRLKNKAEVLTMQVRPPVGPDRIPVAIVADFLKRNPVYHFAVQGRRLLAVTSAGGANRVFDLTSHSAVFQNQPPKGGLLADEQGEVWRVTETGLVAQRDATLVMPRVPAARAFWFGWYAQFPRTELLGAPQ